MNIAWHECMRTEKLCPEIYIYGQVQCSEFVMDDMQSIQPMANFHIGRLHEYIYFIMQLNNALESRQFWHRLSIVHSTSSPSHSKILRSLN